MAHRILLTDRQRSALFDLPTDEASLLKHYTLADDDLEHIRARRRTENRIGFALQLCALRYPGRLLSHGEVIPEPVEQAFVIGEVSEAEHAELTASIDENESSIAPASSMRSVASGDGWRR